MNRKYILKKQIFYKLTKFLFFLFLGISIISLGVYLSSSELIKILYLTNKSKYSEKTATIVKTSYHKSNSPNLRTWNAQIKFQDGSKGWIFLGDLKIDNANSNQQLSQKFPKGTKISVMVKSGNNFSINGRNLNILPHDLVKKTSLKSFFIKISLVISSWLITAILFLYLKNRRAFK